MVQLWQRLLHMVNIIYAGSVVNRKFKFFFGLIEFLLLTNIFNSMAATETVSSGSFIINMGITPQTNGNNLRPYGVVYDLIINYRVPVIWSIEPTKAKDSADFTYNGVKYCGGTFVVPSEYITAAVAARIAYWKTIGVQGLYTTSPVTIPVYTTLTSFPRIMIDNLSGNSIIITTYFDNADIPSSAYEIGAPADLSSCHDIWCNPHADPNWTSHSYLYNFVTTNQGWIWGQCHAVSMLEGSTELVSPYRQLNFLTTNGMKCYSSGNCGSITETHASSSTAPYTYSYPSDPVMQFMSNMHGASSGGSERWFQPLSTGSWNSETKRGVSTNNGTSPGEGTVLVYGPAYNNTSNGWVMYEGGHNLNSAGASVERISAQRAYFNFVLLAGINKQITLTASIPSGMTAGYTYNLSVTVTSGQGPYTYQWVSSLGGTFGSPNAASTTYTPPAVSSDTTDVVRVIVTDACGRVNFDYLHTNIYQVSPLPVTLAAFTSLTKDNGIELHWIVQAEINNDYYTLEKSADGESFENIARVKGMGTTSQTTKYKFMDTDPFPGKSYYRLKQTDYNGRETSLKTINVTFKSPFENFRIISVYPNPLENDFLVVELYSESIQPVNFKLINPMGKVVQSDNFTASEGYIRQRLNNFNSLEKGIYFLSFYSEGIQSRQIKILKQ